MNSTDDQIDTVKRGNVWKGIGLALLCQFAYLLFVHGLSSPDVRALGYMLFALLQFAYLYPLAAFFFKRGQGRTSNGIIMVGAVSMLAVAAWFGYAAFHGTFPLITGF